MVKTTTHKKVKSVIRRGPSTGKKSNTFIVVKEDEPANIVPILPTGEIISIDLHAFWAVNPAVTFACIKNSDDAGDGCPGCKLGDKAGYRAFLPVLDSEGEMKVFAFGISVERQLVTLEDELGSIVGKKLRIKRTGSGLGTKYQVINLGKEVDTSEVDTEEAAEFVEGQIEVKDRSKIIEELRAAGLMGAKKKGEEEEEEVEEEELEDEEEADEEESEDEEDEPKKATKKPLAKKTPIKKVPAKKVVKKVAGKKGKSDDDWE